MNLHTDISLSWWGFEFPDAKYRDDVIELIYNNSKYGNCYDCFTDKYCHHYFLRLDFTYKIDDSMHFDVVFMNDYATCSCGYKTGVYCSHIYDIIRKYCKAEDYELQYIEDCCGDGSINSMFIDYTNEIGELILTYDVIKKAFNNILRDYV